MTSPLLTAYGRTAELARGLKWVDEFESNETVLRNGGVITGAPVINNGATFDGTNDYLLYPSTGLKFEGATDDFSVSCWLKTSTAVPVVYLFNVLDVNDDGWRLILVNGEVWFSLDATDVKASGDLRDDEWHHICVPVNRSGSTQIYVDGAASGAAVNTAGITMDIATNNFSVAISGGGGGEFGGELKDIKIFDTLLTAQEAADYYNRTTWRYRENTKFYLPMRAEQHDPVNVRTLDASGNGNNATFGDGATPATYPTKLARRGYLYDGADYMLSATGIVPVGMTEITSILVVEDITIPGGAYNIATLEDPAIPLTPGYAWTYNAITNTFFFFCGGVGGVNAASYAVGPSPGVFVLIGVHDGTDTIIYVNGERGADAVTPLAPVTNANTRLCIGERVGLIGVHFRGNILHHAVYDIGLTPTQVWDCYLDMIGRLQHV